MAEHNHEQAPSAELKLHGSALGGAFRYIPLFLFVLILYMIGKPLIHDPNAALHLGPNYTLSWVMVLMVVATVLSLVEQMKVSHPGIDNTMEALLMVAMGVVQLLLFVLGAAGVKGFAVFQNTEFFMLMVISMVAAVVAVLINARTLRRTIGVGDN